MDPIRAVQIDMCKSEECQSGSFREEHFPQFVFAVPGW